MKKLRMIAVPVIVGLAIGLIVGQVQLAGREKVHQGKVKELQGRIAAAQRRITEGKTQQASLEQEKQGVLEEVEKMKKEKDQLASESRGLKAKAEKLTTVEARLASAEKKNSSLEARITSLESKNSQMDADRAALDKKQRQTFQTLQDREKELRQVNQKYDRCAENNARLYTTACDMIAKYEARGLFTRIAEKEPFTQVKRVELEKLVQDYRDKIEQSKLRAK